ncbi:MAG: MerR family transcriptional regulator [Patescibacteria group bacterium]
MKNKNKKYSAAGVRVVSTGEARERKLVKIGELAGAYQILPSTINFYTREGLLPEDARSIGGYRLYDRDRGLAVLKKIENFQRTKRYTIEEIKKML